MPQVTRFREEMTECLPPGFVLPPAIGMLCDWIEDNGLLVESEHGRYGVLYPRDRQQEQWTETRRPGGTNISILPGEGWKSRSGSSALTRTSKVPADELSK